MNKVTVSNKQILNIVNLSLNKGVFPNILKTSSVIPIPKLCNSNEAINLRPINTLLLLEKVLELSVYNQLINYLNTNNLISNNQSGFRSKHILLGTGKQKINKMKIIFKKNK